MGAFLSNGTALAAAKAPGTTAKAPGTTAKAPTVDTAKRSQRILVLTPADGPVGIEGSAVLAAVRLAITHGREDGWLPSSTEVDLQRINESSPAAIGAVERSIKNRNDVVAVIGALLPTTAEKLLPALTKSGVPLIALASTTGLKNDADPLALQMSPPNASVGAQLATRLGRVPIVTLLYSQGETASGLRESFVTQRAERFGLRTQTQAIPPKPAGLASLLGDRVPERIAIVGDVRSVDSVMKLVRERIVPIPVVVFGNLDGSTCAEYFTLLRDGDECVSTADLFAHSDAARAFREDFQASRPGVPIGQFSMAAYDGAVHLLRQLVAIPSIGDLSIRRGALASRVRTVSTEGITGTVSFLPTGRRTSELITVTRRFGSTWLPGVDGTNGVPQV